MWFVVCGVWYVVCGLRYEVCGVWALQPFNNETMKQGNNETVKPCLCGDINVH